jgi:hypothetical protein
MTEQAISPLHRRMIGHSSATINVRTRIASPDNVPHSPSQVVHQPGWNTPPGPALTSEVPERFTQA